MYQLTICLQFGAEFLVKAVQSKEFGIDEVEGNGAVLCINCLPCRAQIEAAMKCPQRNF